MTKSWSSAALMAFCSSTWTRQHKSTHHGNSPCTIMGVYAKFHHLPHSPLAWIGGQGGVLEQPRGPGLQHLQPQPLSVSQSHTNLSSPHPCRLRGRLFQQHSDTQIGIWSQIFKGAEAVLHCSWSKSAPTLGVFSSLTTSLHLNKLIQLFLYRQDFNLSI